MQIIPMHTGQAAKQLEYFKGWDDKGPKTDILADALAIAQHHDAVSGTQRQHVAADYAMRIHMGYLECPLLNISYCPPSEMTFADKKNLVWVMITVYNPLGWKRKEVIRIPVSVDNAIVHDYNGTEVDSQLLPATDVTNGFQSDYVRAYLGNLSNVTAKYILAFTVAAAAEQAYSYYYGNDGTDKDPQASGAYVFRPNGTYAINSDAQSHATVVKGPLLEEITRVYKQKEHVEVEFTIGPIPADDGVGKEIVTQISANLKTNRTFYTDSNGRDFIRRINLGIYVKDDNMEMSVLVDRSLGGSSTVDGQIELMLHRRLLHDDIRGVGEVLNETIKGKYFFRIDPVGEGARWRRTVGQEIYSPLLLAFAEQDGDDWMSSHLPMFSGIDPSYSLPENVAVITLQELQSGKVLLRIAHLYEVLPK
ncbi:hypothetical protein V2J09_016577 [Rumex salicifolius]